MFNNIYVFSYNRGEFLKNCIQSIERNFINPNVTIIDDHSDDPETIKYLKELNQKYRIVSPHSKKEKHLKYGNLYKNKNWALNEAKKLNYEYILLSPEDSQYVRPILEIDMKRTEYLFNTTKNIFQLLPVFIEKVNKFAGLEQKINFLDNSPFFTKKENVNFKILNYLDFGLINVKKFFSLLGNYKETETLNAEYCIQKNIISSYYSYPVISMLPFNRYHRIQGNEKLTILINKISQTGFYPYNQMSEYEINELFNKPFTEIAFAEDWLNCPNVPNKDLWSFWGGFFNLEVYEDNRRELAYRLQRLKKSNINEKLKHKFMIEECEKYLKETDNDTPNSENTSFRYY